MNNEFKSSLNLKIHQFNNFIEIQQILREDTIRGYHTMLF